MKRLFLLCCLVLFLCSTAQAIPIALDFVPSYSWYHGCGPTASASIMGYWDLHGYGNLLSATGWDEVSLTANVRDQISSPEHNAKYDSSPDNPDMPPPLDTSLADFWHTSEGSLRYGWSYTHYTDDAYRNYASLMGYDFESQFFSRSWESITTEIDTGNPLSAYVDSNGDGRGDHFIPIFGYDEREDGLFYASYNTWHESETIDWYEFSSFGDHQRFSVGSLAYVRPMDVPIGGMEISYKDFTDPPDPPNIDPVPEPATMLLFVTGLAGLAGINRRRKSQPVMH